MVGQCANFPCTAIFRSLHKGKLFVIAPQESSQRRLNHIWLCEECSQTVTVVVKAGEIRLVPIEGAAAA